MKGLNPKKTIFTVMCLVAWSLNENEGGDELVLIETSLLFLYNLRLISMKIASLTWGN